MFILHKLDAFLFFFYFQLIFAHTYISIKIPNVFFTFFRLISIFFHMDDAYFYYIYINSIKFCSFFIFDGFSYKGIHNKRKSFDNSIRQTGFVCFLCLCTKKSFFLLGKQCVKHVMRTIVRTTVQTAHFLIPTL